MSSFPSDLPETIAPRIRYRRLHAPREDRSFLSQPDFSAIPQLLESNRRARAQSPDVDLSGRRFQELSADAQKELLSAAKAYTSGYRDLPDTPAPATGQSLPLLLSGHQPQLFHPGVLFKSFALSRLAQQSRGIGINLVIDNDVLKSPTLVVPGGTKEAPRRVTLPYDDHAPELPFEARSIVDFETFQSFGKRAAREIRSLVPDSMIAPFWETVIQRGKATGNLGSAFAQARHRWEGATGLQTLELPQSQVCQFPSFHWFMGFLLLQPERFRKIHNAALNEYRAVHHLRSPSHPVPDLEQAEEWIETPFWMWDRESPARRKLFASAQGSELILSDLRKWKAIGPSGSSDNLEKTSAWLKELQTKHGVALRTRALTTTLFARLFLGDLFLHGIGGAKYDQVTDLIIQDLFGLEPPGFVTLTATLHLPIARQFPSQDSIRALQAKLRELTYHPEKHLSQTPYSLQLSGATAANVLSPEANELIATKKQWMQTEQTIENARDLCRAIRAANAGLQKWIAPLRASWEAEVRRLEDSVRDAAILQWREYAFCLYPEKTLQEFLLAISQNEGNLSN